MRAPSLDAPGSTGTTGSMTTESRGISDEGGDPPCWAHQFDDMRHDLGPDDLKRLVVTFYRAAAMDDLLGPIFHAAHVDWSVHIPKLVDFWAWQLFGERGYEGNPLRAHEPSHARTPFRPEHYERWIELFIETVDAQFEGPMAEVAKQRALRMAKALRRLLEGNTARGDEAVSVTLTKPACDAVEARTGGRSQDASRGIGRGWSSIGGGSLGP